MKPIECKVTESPYMPFPKRVIHYRRESKDTFTIRLDWQLCHGVGQFIFCSIPGIGEAPISICSYNERYVELTIHEVGNVTKALSKIRLGSMLYVRGPYGTQYPMKELHGNSLVIVGGGCGVAPLKGLVDYLERNRSDYLDISLFFGFRTQADLLFKSSIARWEKAFKLYISFDKAPGSQCSFGSQGFVTDLVSKNVADNSNKAVMLCGPPVMIQKSVDLLRGKGFNDDQIFFSAERLMYCGIGKCGRCMIHGKYTCLDGPVFRYDTIKNEQSDN